MFRQLPGLVRSLAVRRWSIVGACPVSCLATCAQPRLQIVAAAEIKQRFAKLFNCLGR